MQRIDAVDARRLEDAIARLEEKEEESDSAKGGAAEPAAPQPRRRTDPTLALPGGGVGYKRAVVAEFNRVKRGGRLSRDRLQRVRQGASQIQKRQGAVRRGSEAAPATGATEPPQSEAASSSAADVADGEEEAPRYLRPGDDFAMAFLSGPLGKQVFKWWLGRVTTIYQGAQLRREPLPLDKLPKGVTVVAEWYEPVGDSRTEYRYATLTASTSERQKRQPMHAFMSPVSLTSDADGIYSLDDAKETLESLDETLTLLQAAAPKPSSKAARDEESEGYSAMKVKELKDLLFERGLKLSGKKDELIERLEDSDKAATAGPSTSRRSSKATAGQPDADAAAARVAAAATNERDARHASRAAAADARHAAPDSDAEEASPHAPSSHSSQLDANAGAATSSSAEPSLPPSASPSKREPSPGPESPARTDDVPMADEVPMAEAPAVAAPASFPPSLDPSPEQAAASLLPPGATPLKDFVARLPEITLQPAATLLVIIQDKLSMRFSRLHPPRELEAQATLAEVRRTQQARTTNTELVDVTINNYVVNKDSFARLRPKGLIPEAELRQDLTCNYLNDELVNAWFAALHSSLAREDRRERKVRGIDALTTKKLAGTHGEATVESVRRIVRRLDLREGLFSSSALIFPHVHNFHWTCVVVDFESRSIFSADSMSGQHEDFVKHVCGFMDIASRELRGEVFDFGGWAIGSLGACSPRQPNAFDCGLFPCLIARCLRHRVQLPTAPSQSQMERWRDAHTYELLRGEVRSFV